MIIRDAGPADRENWLGLWVDYLAFYQVDLPEGVTDHTWARIMDPSSSMKLRVAEEGAALLGFAVHMHHPSTWVMGDDCYLEDLFVAETARGRGVGRALIKDLAALAKARGWKRLYWHTDQDNSRARALYDSFTPSDGHLRYRMTL